MYLAAAEGARGVGNTLETPPEQLGLFHRVPSEDRVEVALTLGDKDGIASTGLGFGLQYLLNALPQVQFCTFHVASQSMSHDYAETLSAGCTLFP